MSKVIHYVVQPKFYREFKCVGGFCPNSCCKLWRIDWTKEECERILASDCSEETKALIRENFVYNEYYGKYVVKINKGNAFGCPMLTEEGLCRIQRELGEDYLSRTCKIYPRENYYTQSEVIRTCSSSCCEAMKCICKDEGSMELIGVEDRRSNGKHKIIFGTSDDLKNNPSLKYHPELFKLFWDVISNKKRSLETSVVLGALAAQKLTEFISRGEYDRIPEVIKALGPQLSALSIPSVDNLKTNYPVALGVVGQIVDMLKESDILDSLRENGALSAQRYEDGRRIFEEAYGDKPYFLRNLALNYILECRLMFFNNSAPLFDNYCYYAAAIAVTKLLSYAVCARDGKASDKIFTNISFFNRSLFHDRTYFDKVIHILKENGCTSPSYIALMVK